MTGAASRLSGKSRHTSVWLVVAREMSDRLRNRAYVIGTLAVIVLAVGAIVVPTLLPRGDVATWRLGVVDHAADELATALSDHADVLSVRSVTDRQEGIAQVRSGQLDGVLVDRGTLLVDGEIHPQVINLIEHAMQRIEQREQLTQLDVPPSQVDRLLAINASVSVTYLDGTATADPAGADMMVAFLATILLFLAIQINGSSLLTGAIEEKSSRVVEVVLATVRPRQLLAGKIIALTVLALAQLGLIVGSMLVANRVVGAVDLPDTTAQIVAVAVVMVLAGFMFYAALYTVAGSMASSVEDAQAIAGPLSFAVIATYMLVLLAVIPSPGGTTAQVLTYLPPTAPFTVPARLAMHAIEWWELVAAFAVTVLGSLVAVSVAARLYAAALLAGGRLTWRAAWRADRIR